MKLHFSKVNGLWTCRLRHRLNHDLCVGKPGVGRTPEVAYRFFCIENGLYCG